MVSPGAAQPDGGADLILRGGTIYSGEAAPFRGDVAIRGDRIIYLGPKAPGTAARTIDATGPLVPPGLLDPHTNVGAARASSALAAPPLLPLFTHGVPTTFFSRAGSRDQQNTRPLRRPTARSGAD